jgi:hypothetical protein
MNYRSAFFLFLSALGLWAYLLIWEAKQLNTEEQKEQAVAVLPQSRDKIISLSLSSPKQKVTLSKQQDEQWIVTAPVNDLAEPIAVEALLSQLEYAKASRILNEQDDAFGINEQSPSIQMMFQNNTKLILLVGADAVGGALFYAFRSDTKQVLLLPKSLKNILTQDLERFRAQQAFTLRRESIESITMQAAPQKNLRLQKNGNFWQEESPNIGRVDPAKFESLLRSLQALQVKKFVAEVPPTLEGEERVITVESKEGTQVVSFVGPYKENGESFFLGKRKDALFSIDATLVENLWNQPEELRDIKVFSDLTDLKELQFQRGTEKVRLYHGEKTWQSEPASEIDAREVELYREALSRLLVRSFAKPDQAIPPSTQGVLPSLQLTFADKSQQLFQVGPAASPGFVWLARDKEWVEVPEDVVSLLAPDLLRFQPKMILKVGPNDVSAITIQREGQEVRLEKRGNLWWQKAPFEVLADQRATEGLLISFEELRAVRFLAKGPTLDKPLMEATIFLKNGEAHKILLGEANDGGERFAKVDEREVCTISNALWLSLGADFVERRAFITLDAESLQSLTLTQQKTTVTIKKTIDGWAGTDGQSYTTSSMNKFLQDITDITAEQVVPFDAQLVKKYGLDTVAFSGELQGKTEAISFVLGSVADDKGLVALRFNGSGPLYLLSAEEASYLTMPTPKTGER